MVIYLKYMLPQNKELVEKLKEKDPGFARFIDGILYVPANDYRYHLRYLISKSGSIYDIKLGKIIKNTIFDIVKLNSPFNKRNIDEPILDLVVRSFFHYTGEYDEQLFIDEGILQPLVIEKKSESIIYISGVSFIQFEKDLYISSYGAIYNKAKNRILEITTFDSNNSPLIKAKKKILNVRDLIKNALLNSSELYAVESDWLINIDYCKRKIVMRDLVPTDLLHITGSAVFQHQLSSNFELAEKVNISDMKYSSMSKDYLNSKFPQFANIRMVPWNEYYQVNEYGVVREAKTYKIVKPIVMKTKNHTIRIFYKLTCPLLTEIIDIGDIMAYQFYRIPLHSSKILYKVIQEKNHGVLMIEKLYITPQIRYIPMYKDRMSNNVEVISNGIIYRKVNSSLWISTLGGVISSKTCNYLRYFKDNYGNWYVNYISNKEYDTAQAKVFDLLKKAFCKISYPKDYLSLVLIDGNEWNIKVDNLRFVIKNRLPKKRYSYSRSIAEIASEYNYELRDKLRNIDW